MVYLVRCAECDQAFWLAAADAPVPPHASWNRHSAETFRGRACPGSGSRGHWVVESEEPAPVIVRGGPARPAEQRR